MNLYCILFCFSARPGRPPKRSNHFLSDISEVSPSKLVRKSSEPMFPFDGKSKINSSLMMPMY